MVDILIVMDNSGSMHIESQYIRDYLPELMKHIWRSDWRLGMVNSSGSNCNVTTLTALQASDSNTINYHLDRDSMIYSNFNSDLARMRNNQPTPWYLTPYFYHHTSYRDHRVTQFSDYRWLSPCGYNTTGSCSSSTIGSGSTGDYARIQNFNPLKYYFGKEGLSIFATDPSMDSGNERMLKKVRWVLEGKQGTTCEGWARDKATVIAIVITDEGHNCAPEDHMYCSVDSYKAFASSYGSNRKFKTYGILSSDLQNNRRTYVPNWDSDELSVFDGYVINYNDKFEGNPGSQRGYFVNLSNGYRTVSPPTRVSSSNTGYYNKLSSAYGHRSLSLMSMAIADELRNIYSPLTHVPDPGTATVRVASYVTDQIQRSAEYKYGSDIDHCGAAGLAATDPCYVVHADQKAFELVQYGNMSHFDKKVKVTYNYGGISTSAIPFDTSWRLPFAPDPASIVFSIVYADGTSGMLTRGTDYTVSGQLVSVAQNRVQNLVPQGSSITIKYQSQVNLNSNFVLASAKQLPAGAEIVAGSAQVVQIAPGGSESPPTTTGFTFDGTTVSFQSGIPVAGGGFRFSYQYRGAVLTGINGEYSYIRASNTDSSIALSCTSVQRGSMVTCSHDTTSNRITFSSPSEFAANDQIRIVETLVRGAAPLYP